MTVTMKLKISRTSRLNLKTLAARRGTVARQIKDQEREKHCNSIQTSTNTGGPGESKARAVKFFESKCHVNYHDSAIHGYQGSTVYVTLEISICTVNIHSSVVWQWTPCRVYDGGVGQHVTLANR